MLLVEDADIPLVVPVTHLIVHSIDPALPGIEPGAVPRLHARPIAGRLGLRTQFSSSAVGWTPPAPPPGHGLHRYAFQLFALSKPPSFRYPPHRGRLMRQIRPHILAQGRLVGTYIKH